jgi:drug/metabolite transporter (DMT)-like permease
MWFSSSGLLAVFGWSISAFLFKDSINAYQIAGAAAVVAGTMLMGVK